MISASSAIFLLAIVVAANGASFNDILSNKAVSKMLRKHDWSDAVLDSVEVNRAGELEITFRAKDAPTLRTVWDGGLSGGVHADDPTLRTIRSGGLSGGAHADDPTLLTVLDGGLSGGAHSDEPTLRTVHGGGRSGGVSGSEDPDEPTLRTVRSGGRSGGVSGSDPDEPTLRTVQGGGRSGGVSGSSEDPELRTVRGGGRSGGVSADPDEPTLRTVWGGGLSGGSATNSKRKISPNSLLSETDWSKLELFGLHFLGDGRIVLTFRPKENVASEDLLGNVLYAVENALTDNKQEGSVEGKAVHKAKTDGKESSANKEEL